MFDECPRHHSHTAFALILVCVLILVAFSPNASAQSVNCAGVPAWAANTSYSVGQLVTYSNVEYRCLQGHTSQIGWEPPSTPALWQQMGSCSTSTTPTPKPTTTATPKPTGTATPKPTASPTPKATPTATSKPTATATAKPTATPTPIVTGCSVGSTVSFASKANGLYVTADTRVTNSPLLAETSTAQAWEEYDIVDAGGGWIALKAHSNGFYVSADLSASGALEAGWATTIQAWEEFQLSTTSDGYVALKANANSFYVSANLGAANSPLTAGWATTVQDWEKFTCTPIGGVSASGPRQKLLSFIGSISGRQTMAGEHNRESSEGNFIQAMDNITGDYPALWGGDFLYESDQIANRQNMISYEISGGKGGALISLMYHACPPTQSESCGWQGGVLSSLTDAQWSDLITDGGQLNGVWKSRLDSIAPYFQQIQSAGLPVLFRPFHEMNQGVFWWAGRQGPNGTAKLYQLTHDYLINHWGLNNIVWVWSMQDIWDSSTNSYDFSQYDPGSAYWDVMSLDFYDGAGFTTAKYNMMTSYAGSKPIAIGECQVLPTPSELAAQPRWIYFMGWAELIQQNESNAAIQSTYWGPSVLTENGNNKMPGW